MKSTNNKNRVLVVGLDGATFEIISPMVAEGKLPNLERLMREGSFGPLKSTMPPVTPCAWTSFATGKDPSKHGLYDFRLLEGNPENKKNANRTFIRAKSLWKILGEAGKKSIVIDVPLTYPPEEVNGILISRVMAPQKKNCTYPKSLYYTLRKKGYIKKDETKIADEHGADNANKEEVKEKPDKLTKAEIKKKSRERIEKAFKHMKEEVDKNIELTKWLMNKKDWDFFMIVFMSADHAGHTFWKYQSRVKKIYQKLDKAVGEIFKLAGDDTTKFIMSDHGFTTIPYYFNANEWLHSKDLLIKRLDIPLKESMKELKQYLLKVQKQKTRSTKAKKPEKLSKFRFRVKTDYRKSKAYLQSGTCYGIRINLEGRDTTGIVKKEDYESFRDYLIEELGKVEHPLSGRKVFSHILKKEDVYSESPSGIDPAPDIFLLTPDMEVMLQGQFGKVARIFGKTAKGYGFHHTDGIVFARGQGIENLSLHSSRITDLAPTILHVMGVPIPDDMDGRVLSEIFHSDSRYAKEEIRYQGSSAIEREQAAYSKKEEEEMKKHLEALGYIG